MNKMYNRIKDLLIRDLPDSDLKVWIMDELIELINDLGQKVDDDILTHTAARFLEILKQSYGFWIVADVHSALKLGLTEKYGKFYKVSVKSLLQFMAGANRDRMNRYASQAEEENDEQRKDWHYYQNRTANFIAWASSNMICLDFLNPDWNPVKEKQVCPEIVEMSKKWQEAKESNKLERFKIELKNMRNEKCT